MNPTQFEQMSEKISWIIIAKVKSTRLILVAKLPIYPKVPFY